MKSHMWVRVLLGSSPALASSRGCLGQTKTEVVGVLQRSLPTLALWLWDGEEWGCCGDAEELPVMTSGHPHM